MHTREIPWGDVQEGDQIVLSRSGTSSSFVYIVGKLIDSFPGRDSITVDLDVYGSTASTRRVFRKADYATVRYE